MVIFKIYRYKVLDGIASLQITHFSSIILIDYHCTIIVDVKLRDHGSKLVEVTDNGQGVEEKNFAGLSKYTILVLALECVLGFI